MYKYDDGAYLAGHGGILSTIGPQFVGSYEGESHHDHHPQGFGDGE